MGSSNIAPGVHTRQVPRLLSPAGQWDCARAAVENGADAIYFGLDQFNARMRADNFKTEDLPDLMRYLHRRGVQGYLTLNTLIFESEMPLLSRYLEKVIDAGVDAVIVQDVGVCKLIREISHDFPIHASTQMTITSAEGIRQARQLGCSLAVLARECSLVDIRKIQEELLLSEDPELQHFPLEVFVHGALCVAYSGQCLTSEALGGRSANRGECAQACRMPYELVVDGKPWDLQDKKYLLSPQDLAGLPVLPELVGLGLACLKIEGRLKSPEYVASITRVYREGIDACRASEPTQQSWKDRVQEDRYEMEMAFSRGLYTGWFNGIQNQELVHAIHGGKRGARIGVVRATDKGCVWVENEIEVKPGDGVVFEDGGTREKETGGRIYEVHSRGNLVGLTFRHGILERVRPEAGQVLWKTNDPALDKRVRRTFEGDSIRFQRPVQARIEGGPGRACQLILTDSSGLRGEAESAQPLSQATGPGLTGEYLHKQLGRMGGTPVFLAELVNQLEPGCHLPVSELNSMRRAAMENLMEAREGSVQWHRSPTGPEFPGPSDKVSFETSPCLILGIRTLEQLEVALEAGLSEIYCDFENHKLGREAVAMSGKSGASIFLAPPRIFKPGEERILDLLASANPAGFLARNARHLSFFKGHRLRGDFSLNVANSRTANWFLDQVGLESLTASYDLNFDQLLSLIQATDPRRIEVTLHQHMPMFHMEHCVFCAFLSTGKDYRDCGRPCEKHEVKLRDRTGQEHLLKADTGCRNTVYNARAQTGAEYLDRFLASGIRRFRMELVDESPQITRELIQSYRQLLKGECSGEKLWRQFQLTNQLGVTRGTLKS